MSDLIFTLFTLMMFDDDDDDMIKMKWKKNGLVNVHFMNFNVEFMCACTTFGENTLNNIL